MKVSYNTVYWEETDDIGHLVINSPTSNKMTFEFFNEMNLLFRNAVIGSQVKGILVYGAGRHFSSGADIGELKHHIAVNTALDNQTNPASLPSWYLDFCHIGNYLRQLNIPVVAAVNGICYGSGFEFSLWCHCRIIGESTLFSLPEVSFGFLPGWGGIPNLADIIGYGRALDMVLTGKVVHSDEACSIGIADRMVSRKKLIYESESFIRYIIDTGGQYNPCNMKKLCSIYNEKNYHEELR